MRTPVGRWLRRPSTASFLAACLSSALPAHAADAGNALSSGHALLERITGSEEGRECSDALCRARAVSWAQGYIAAVADSSAGQWCGRATVLPHELVDRVYSHLKALPRARLEEDASTLAREALVHSFPCAHAAPSSNSRPAQE
ncbi:Rap1a/Tai family immunity protein [Stenotrophomonas maltophilia]|uniref:Rap1a/Tai family immunity protein n=1 Tax=Stenotrophomonas maltophilia TaxID=40324 RepID=UPI000B140AC1|nr:Rap1a/Tai family immunity protein [Stenotrophomonas maltophilia]